MLRAGQSSTDKLSSTPSPTPFSSTAPTQGTPTITPTQKPSSTTTQSILHNSTPQPIVPKPTPLLHAPDRTMEEEIGNATQYLAQSTVPFAVITSNVLDRQFGIPQFSNSLQKYDQLIAGNPDPTMMLFRRIACYNNSVDSCDYNSLQYDVDRLTVPALYSDRWTLPDNYSEMLQAGLEGGGYLTTHTLLATFWLKENNCTVALPANFTNQLYLATAAIINNDSEVTDVEIEAAAFLYEAGQGQLVSSSFIHLVMINQNVDGGWAPASDIQPNMSDWHPTFLALMLLLNVDHSSNTYRPWLST